MKFSIYGLATEKEPDVIRYIGLTKNTLAKRLAQHKAASKRLKHHAACWIKSNNCEIISVLIEDDIDLADILDKEIMYIKLFKSQGARLVNGNNGGMVYTNPEAVSLSKKGMPKTLETIAKIKAGLALEDPIKKAARYKHIHSTRGKPFFSEEARAKISSSGKGRIKTQEELKKISEANTGKKRTDEQRRTISLAHIGIRQTAESIAKRVAKAFNKPQVWVVQMDEQGNTIKEWGSGRIANRDAGFNYKHISACINGKRKTAGGFYWKRKEI